MKSQPTLYIESLDYLSSFGIGYKTDIRPIISKKIIGKVKTEVWNKSVENCLNVLKAMKKYGHINYSEDQNLLTILVDDGGKYLVEITANGFEYIDKLRSNKSIRLTNRVTVVALVLTISFSIATVLITILNYNLSGDNYKLSLQTAKADSINSITVSRRLDTLQQVLKSLQESLPLPKDQKTSQPQKHPSH